MTRPQRRPSRAGRAIVTICGTLLAAVLAGACDPGVPESPSGAPGPTSRATGTSSTSYGTPGGPSTPTATPTPTPQWTATRAWTEKFSGAAGTLPDPSLFSYQLGGTGWGNHELQTYTSRAENAALDGQGNLAITARRETYTGTDGTERDWTSARLHSYDSFAFTYGILSARIKVPSGPGIWPAFWLVGRDITEVGWPKSGEIDIMETVNAAMSVGSTVHGPTSAGRAWQISHQQPSARSYADTFHVYSVERRKDQITFRIDGVAVAHVVPAQLKPNERWVFEKPMCFLLNVAVGGDLPGSPTAKTPDEASMLVDWISFRP
ncbi:beta-glucanase (GH16 family) [Jatrophihabitans sp. GAS493]|uniref:glycoside hydrolase family 16 protein n=1 Tax=Jatrophihabitans sp. GAS493 TaxID=1907575 RepID=UPI000BC08B52|nr:glycoside hydrolase family 16 protein [Jatrophihabitans sp. GAS493]SOD71574.1 beta-glucanase (GH16 family) [Jatrophihabitans sp. GAS493]